MVGGVAIDAIVGTCDADFALMRVAGGEVLLVFVGVCAVKPAMRKL